MNILIAYAGKSGTTKKCAHLLEQKLNHAQTELVDLTNCMPDPSLYDCIVVGGSIRMSQINKPVKQFLQRYQSILLSKRIGIFICCGFSDKSQEYFDANISKELRDSAVSMQCFGGDMDVDKLKGLDKIIVKMVTSATEGDNPPPSIFHDRIDEFAQAMLKV